MSGLNMSDVIVFVVHPDEPTEFKRIPVSQLDGWKNDGWQDARMFYLEQESKWATRRRTIEKLQTANRLENVL